MNNVRVALRNSKACRSSCRYRTPAESDRLGPCVNPICGGVSDILGLRVNPICALLQREYDTSLTGVPSEPMPPCLPDERLLPLNSPTVLEGLLAHWIPMRL